MHIHNAQCDAQSAQSYLNMSAVMQPPFKFQSSANNNRHLILALKCLKILGLKNSTFKGSYTNSYSEKVSGIL